MLAGFTKCYLVDRMMFGATESASIGKMVEKVAPSTLAWLRRPLFEMSANIAEGLIEGTFWYKRLLAK